MAKHYSKRASKKRAHKKRRTVRKVRNTIRRKIQVGGIDGTTPIILMIIAGPFIALIGLDRIMLFLNILLILLGQQPMSMPGGQRGGGGFFNLNTLKTLKDKANAGVDTLKAKASGLAPILHSIKGAAPDQLNNFKGELRSITEYGPTAPSGSSLKTRLIDKLTELKIKLDAEPAMYDKASACLQKIIDRIEGGQINIDNPTQTSVVVEPVGNISDILKNAITAASVSEDSSVLDRIRSKFTIGLNVLKEELTKKIDKLINSIKLRYSLSQEDIECFTTLKNALLNAIIRKKDAALTTVMDNANVKQAMSMGAAMKEGAGAVIGDLKTGLTGLTGRFRKSSPVAPPDTAVLSDAEIRDLENKATTSKALAYAKKRKAVEADDILKMATPAVNTMPTKEQRDAYAILQRNARATKTAAAAAAVIAESAAAALQEAKSAKAAAAATATPASRLSRFNPFNR